MALTSVDVSGTLRAQEHGHPPYVLETAGFCTEHSASSRSIGYAEEVSPTLRAGVVPAAVTLYENHPQDARCTGPLGTAPTVSHTYGTGGNNQPFVVEGVKTYDVRFTSEGTRNARQNVYATDTARTIDTGGGSPDSNQGGIAVVEGPSYVMTTGAYTQIAEERSPTLTARDFKSPSVVNRGYSVRRLTATECARLQGFPDWWCSGLETPEPIETDITFWTEVWETRLRVAGRSTRPKSRNQVIKWLKDPYSEAAEYTMWGNGVALPCVFFVLSGIVWAAQLPAQ